MQLVTRTCADAYNIAAYKHIRELRRHGYIGSSGWQMLLIQNDVAARGWFEYIRVSESN